MNRRPVYIATIFFQEAHEITNKNGCLANNHKKLSVGHVPYNLEKCSTAEDIRYHSEELILFLYESNAPGSRLHINKAPHAKMAA